MTSPTSVVSTGFPSSIFPTFLKSSILCFLSFRVFSLILLLSPFEYTHTILLLPFWIVLFKSFDLMISCPSGNHFWFMCFHLITYQSVSAILLDFQLSVVLLHKALTTDS